MTEKEINKLVSDNINYVKSVANHYRGNGVDFDDLVSEGTLAMLTAAQKYDAERGSQFVAYASPFIRKAMQQTIDKQAALYRVPKDQKKHAPRNATKAVSIDAPISEDAEIEKNTLDYLKERLPQLPIILLPDATRENSLPEVASLL